MMEEKISFERFLFGDGNEVFIDDMEFCVDRIVILPKIRPHHLEKALRLSLQYCQIADFRGKLLEKIDQCPALIHKLYKRGVFVFKEIEPYMREFDSILLYYYFRKQIDDFNTIIQCKRKPENFGNFSTDETKDIDQLIEYGFYPSSIEYLLKYDVIDELESNNILNEKAQWSPFEWSNRPKYLDLLSFSGFFGSIKCFKHLLIKGFKINDKVFSMVVCNGCFDLFHLCQEQRFLTSDIICMASTSFQLSLLTFMFENGADMNSRDKKYKIQYLI